MIIKNCEYCSKEFSRKDSSYKYCSRSCSASYNNSAYPKRIAKLKPVKDKRNSVQKWLDGDFNGITKVGVSKPIRDFLIEKANYKCQSPTCSIVGGWSGFNPVSGKTTLTVDHIDGKSYNNTANNLIVLCPNCHSLTPTYGALNKGNGRKARYQSLTQQ